MNIKVLYVEPETEPYIKETDNGLKGCQDLVGGYIESFYPFLDDGSTFFCNEEGKLNGMPFNREIISDTFHDLIFGSFFICESDDEGNLTSISDELADKYKAMFSLREEEIQVEVKDE